MRGPGNCGDLEAGLLAASQTGVLHGEQVEAPGEGQEALRDGAPGVPPPRRLRISPDRLAIFLDIDGTLAPITARPEFTQIPVETRRTLLDLERGGVALAAISGRPLTQVRRLLLPLRIPASGSHGAQIGPIPGNSIRVAKNLPPALLDHLIEGVQKLPGVWLERKPAALAIHWRQAPECRQEVEALATSASRLVHGWRVIPGHCVHELKPAGRNKGVALKWFMSRPGFSGRWPLAIGDDRTDEDAFRAALALGGSAVRIGTSGQTMAPWRLPDVESLAFWLKEQVHSS